MYNWFDIVVVIALSVMFVKGYLSGAIKMLFGLLIVILSIVFGSKLGSIISPYLAEITNLTEQWANIVSYVIAVVLLSIVMTVVGRIAHKFIKLINLSFVNRIIGGILSMGISMIFMSIILNFFLLIDTENRVLTTDIKSKSFFYDRVQSVLPAIIPYVNLDYDNKKVGKDYLYQIIKESSLKDVSIDFSYQSKFFN